MLLRGPRWKGKYPNIQFPRKPVPVWRVDSYLYRNLMNMGHYKDLERSKRESLNLDKDIRTSLH